MRRPYVAIAIAVAVLGAATAAGLAIAGCGSSDDTSQAAASTVPNGQPPDMTSMFRTHLDKLVAAGTITSDQEEAVLEAIGASMPSRGQGGAPPTGGQAGSGTTPSQGATPPSGQSGPPDLSSTFATALDKLVDEGTITAKQEKAIVSALSSSMQPPQGGQAPGSGGSGGSGGSSPGGGSTSGGGTQSI